MKSIYSNTRSTLINTMEQQKIKDFQTKQIFQWLYQKRITSFDEMTNLSKDLRSYLKENSTFQTLELSTMQKSSDGTIKFLFKLMDGHQVETVLMPQEYGNSVCVSSQVGCNMGCVFCASGEIKKVRDLTVDEMVLQVLEVQRYLDATEQRVSHVVVMGIGEPFDNYENLIDFLYIINDPFGLAIGARHITVSTCGLVGRIREFAQLPLQVNLALSLHAATDEKRRNLMPISQRYTLDQIFDALSYYYDKTNRRVTIEYILLKDINDFAVDATQLIALLSKKNVYVNLIPYNEVDTKRFEASTKQTMLKFLDQLKKAHIQCTIRREFGNDISGACGQLRVQKMKEGVDDESML